MCACVRGLCVRSYVNDVCACAGVWVVFKNVRVCGLGLHTCVDWIVHACGIYARVCWL